MFLSLNAYLRIVRASAWYDLVVTAPFLTPWSFSYAQGHLSMLNVRLGGMALPVFGAFQTLFVCLMGSVVLVWSLARLHAPSIAGGRFDGMARLLFALWMAWTLALTGAPLLWLFIVPECAWGVAQFLPVKQMARRSPA
ncbi:hypothetical protein [Massilia sp. 9096]|uniref:hypothetical protein n=1 Tax=Massilia sp. 9096 TaxID=1500894 RepID=UPI000559FE51|nr:hypothetical protein [Massilia sp. 9096]